MTDTTHAGGQATTAATGPSALPDDLPPGAVHRAAAYLGLTDDAPRLERGTRAWWTRTAVFAAGLLVMIVLVAVGG